MKNILFTALVILSLVVSIFFGVSFHTQNEPTQNNIRVSKSFSDKKQISNIIKQRKPIEIKLNKDNNVDFISIDFENEVKIAGNGRNKIEATNRSFGGEKSLYIIGGCIQPRAVINLTNYEMKGTFELSFWAKVIDGGGGNIFIAGNSTWDSLKNNPMKQEKFDFNNNKRFITSNVWKFYKKRLNLKFRKKDNIRLYIYCGGFVKGSMFIDNIHIRRLSRSFDH